MFLDATWRGQERTHQANHVAHRLPHHRACPADVARATPIAAAVFRPHRSFDWCILRGGLGSPWSLPQLPSPCSSSSPRRLSPGAPAGVPSCEPSRGRSTTTSEPLRVRTRSQAGPIEQVIANTAQNGPHSHPTSPRAGSGARQLPPLPASGPRAGLTLLGAPGMRSIGVNRYRPSAPLRASRSGRAKKEPWKFTTPNIRYAATYLAVSMPSAITWAPCIRAHANSSDSRRRPCSVSRKPRANLNATGSASATSRSQRARGSR